MSPLYWQDFLSYEIGVGGVMSTYKEHLLGAKPAWSKLLGPLNQKPHFFHGTSSPEGGTGRKEALVGATNARHTPYHV